MTIHVHDIATRVPPFGYHQDFIRDRMIEWLPGRRNARLLRALYNRSGIDTRYSVLPDFAPGQTATLFNEDSEGRVVEPTTGERNQYFRGWARTLAVEAGKEVLEAENGFDTADITHVVTVSCTGFTNPGLDLDLVRELGLAPGTERYHIGFMGCYAAFPALRMAEQFCRARPDAVVLVVSVELCTLHFQLNPDADSLLANTLFADGAAAALVSARAPRSGRPALALHRFVSDLAPEGSEDMAWTIGDRGFDIRLSTYVPDIIAKNIIGIVDRFLGEAGMNRKDIGTWAIHPGGRSILDKIEHTLALTPEQLHPSREVLRQYGNMSSATILFVLKEILDRDADTPDEHLLAMAFGPGLTIESAVMQRVSGAAKPLEYVAAEVEYVAD